jgi:hypothetical protein
LNEFREYLKPKDVIKSDKHFNMQLLVEAFKLYNENYDRFGGWNAPKNNLCWCKVIGFIQRFLPANYAQAFCQGVYYIVESNEKLNRSLKFRYGNNISFFPLDTFPSSRLGFDFAGGVYATMGDAGPGARARKHQPYINFVKQKTSTLHVLMQPRCKRSKTWCSIQ